MELTEIFNFAISLLTLTFLEIVLGVDNLIFISIACGRLPRDLRKRAARFGLLLALGTRLILLASVLWLSQLTKPLFTLFSIHFSGRDIFLLLGGLFLMYKATQEIHAAFDLEHEKAVDGKKPRYANFFGVITQIAILDIVFSLDSVITAVGLTQHFSVMAIAISLAILTMMFLNEPLNHFIHENPTVKMLALAFLLTVGLLLLADGLHYHISRGYLYFSICFSIGVETLNILLSKKKSRLEKK